MMTKEEYLELAKKCGLHIPINTPHYEYEAKLAAYTSAIEEKYQAQIAMLAATVQHMGDAITDMFEQMEKGKWVDDYEHPVRMNQAMLNLMPAMRHAIAARDSTQATSDAFIAEVKAGAQQKVLEELSNFFSDAIQGDFENGVKSLNERECAEFKRRFPNIWEGISKINTMLDAAELRNSATQPSSGNDAIQNAMNSELKRLGAFDSGNGMRNQQEGKEGGK